MGTLHKTVTGKQCQKWSSDSPHVTNPSYTDDDFPDGSRVAAENYCRNPDPSWSRGVWCYTIDPDVRWEDCDVPICGKFFLLPEYLPWRSGVLFSVLSVCVVRIITEKLLHRN